MIVMQRDAKVSTNEVGNALGGPQLIGPTVGLGALKQQLLQFLLLGDGQAGRMDLGLGGQSVWILGVLEPAMEGTWSDAHDAGDVLHFVTLLDGENCLASPLFQRAGRSDWSAHAYIIRRQSRSLPAQLSVMSCLNHFLRWLSLNQVRFEIPPL